MVNLHTSPEDPAFEREQAEELVQNESQVMREGPTESKETCFPTSLSVVLILRSLRRLSGFGECSIDPGSR
jgi:hypothetical protein